MIGRIKLDRIVARRIQDEPLIPDFTRTGRAIELFQTWELTRLEPVVPGKAQETVFKDIVRRWTVSYPGYGSEQVDRYYDEAAKIRKIEASRKHHRRLGRDDASEAKMAENPWLDEVRGPAEAVASRMANLTRQAREIDVSRDLTPQQKRAELDYLAFQRQMEAEQFLGLLDEARAQAKFGTSSP